MNCLTEYDQKDSIRITIYMEKLSTNLFRLVIGIFLIYVKKMPDLANTWCKNRYFMCIFENFRKFSPDTSSELNFQ